MKINVTISFQNAKVRLEVDQTDTLQRLKEVLEKKLGIPAQNQVLNYRNQRLDDDRKTLIELGINNDETIYVNDTIQKNGLYKNGVMSVMGSPVVKNILKNKDAMKTLLESMPGMREEMEKNSELRMMLNNPQIYEEMEKIAEDPEYMNQQLKNVDLAMQKLENIPGGLNMMNSMLKEVRDPLSFMMDGRNSFKIKTNLPEQSVPVPNPWTRQKVNHVVLYRRQLEILRECGFTDLSKNIKFLKKNDGDVDMTLVELAESNGGNI